MKRSIDEFKEIAEKYTDEFRLLHEIIEKHRLESGSLHLHFDDRNVQIQEENRVPNEKELIEFLKTTWKTIYRSQQLIDKETYYTMKGHIKRHQFDVFFQYLRNRVPEVYVKTVNNFEEFQSKEQTHATVLIKTKPSVAVRDQFIEIRIINKEDN